MDHRNFELLVAEVNRAVEGRALFDARHLRWVDPMGMVGLLSAGAVVRDRTGFEPRLQLPDHGDVPGYLARMGFYEAARGVFEGFPGRAGKGQPRSSDVLLEITPITTNGDIHSMVDRVQSQAVNILTNTLHFPSSSVVQFAVILSEVCQNILEHAEAPGWVAAQAYNWTKRLGRHVLLLAVSDLGRGFRGSLHDEHSARFGDRWGDATALEAAFMHGLTRFPDPGRGQGIQQIRRQVRKWDGSISIRSGTARIAQAPEWDDLPPLEEGLEPFPGSQIHIILPAREVHEPS
jgi:hypothetical protein